MAGVSPVSFRNARPNWRGHKTRDLGQPLDRQPLRQVFAREGERDPHPVGLGLHLRQGGELRLPAWPPVIDDQLAGYPACQLDAVFRLDQPQRKVDAGGDGRRSP